MGGVSNKILAVAIDACEPALLHKLMERGQLPHLSKIADSGRSSSTTSHANIGSGSVWPTFIHGAPPTEHGVYGEWMWSPAEMRVERWRTSARDPFWATLRSQRRSVGVLDVPFVPLTPQEDGFLISEWGAHDVLSGSLYFSPPSIGSVLEQSRPHPFGSNPPTVSDEDDSASFSRVVAAAREGVGARTALAASLLGENGPDLAIIYFPELHHVAHFCWDQETLPANDATPLRTLLMQIDDALGELISVATSYDSVMSFSLHGFRPSRGIVNVLPALLRKHGLSHPPRWRNMNGEERRSYALASMKRLAPGWIKTAYHRGAGLTLQQRLAGATMLETQDWGRTKAFALPTDQHGWVRINMRGRERLGIVDPVDYISLRDQIADLASSLQAQDGKPLVRSIEFPFSDASEAAQSILPDVVIHWSPAAHERGQILSGGEPMPPPRAPHLSGQHDVKGFCVSMGPLADRFSDEIAGERMGQHIVAQLLQER